MVSYRRRVLSAAAVMVVSCCGTIAASYAFVDREAIQYRTFSELCAEAPSSQSLKSLWEILSTNFSVAAALVLGGFLIGIRTVIQLVVVGADLGQHIAAAHITTNSWTLTVAALGTHGALELAALAAAGATGLGLAEVVVRKVIRRSQEPWRESAKALARELIRPAIGLLIAALIEEFLTSSLIRQVLGCG